MTEQRRKKLKRQLQESRRRLYRQNEEFSYPLWEMIFVATKDVKRMSTNGTCIYFDPDWLQKLGHKELDFMLMHQLMHIALGHIDRPRYYTGDRFHLACDIVANSNLEVFGWNYDKLPYVGKIYHETFFPAIEGSELTAQKALKCIPFDPATMKNGVKRNYMIDSEEWWDRKADRGEQGEIVLSPDESDPDDLLGYEDTRGGNHFCFIKEFERDEGNGTGEEVTQPEQEETSQDKWQVRMSQVLMSLRAATKKDSAEEAFVERIWQRVNNGKLNWRKLLDNFIQEEVCDYSFTPPDRRMQDSAFFLPDYHVQTETPREVWFMVDTSGSIEEDTLAVVYGEICNALTQFQGGLVGVLCFFDTRVHVPIYFSDVSSLREVCPIGGGGTDYHKVFRYINENAALNPPANIVIFTDGAAEFPEEQAAGNIPVLWLFSEKGVRPPWGKYAYVEE